MENNMAPGGMAPPQKKQANTSLIIGIIVGVVALAAIAVMLVMFVFSPNGGSSALRDPEPLFYMEDDDIYMAVGAETIELEDAALSDSGYGSSINGMMSFDRRYVYYLADVDDESGVGKLMVVDTKGSLDPEIVAEDVCEAVISLGGGHFLYLADIEDEIGTLYYCKMGGEAEKISSDVVSGQYGLSPNGRKYYFVKRMSDDEDEAFTVYAALGGGEPDKVDDGEAGEGDVISLATVTDDGEFIYEFGSMDDETYEYDTTLYVYADGDRDKIASDATIKETFGSASDILYSEDRTLYYKAPGEDKERLSKDFDGVVFPPYYGSDPNYEHDKHFLLVESDEDENDQVTLYEMRIGQEPVKITKADRWGYSINADFSWVSFQRDGELYLCYKDGNDWSDRIEVCENVLSFGFDMSGKYLYYIESYDEDDDYGDLYRYTLSSRTDEAQMLQYDVQGFQLVDNILYTNTADDEIFRVESEDDKTLLFDEETLGGGAAPDGLYLVVEAKDYDIYYVPADGSESEAICFDAQDVLYLDGIISHNFTPPISDELAQTMREVYEDTVYFMDAINNTNNSTMSEYHQSYQDTLQMLNSMRESKEISDKVLAMIDDFYWGYYYIAEYAETQDGSAEEQEAIDQLNGYFEDAFDKYDVLIGR